MARHAADLLADRDIVRDDALFPFWCVASLAMPFGLGWLLGGAFGAALSALLWAGLVRIFVLHHVTWSINSVCHMFGRRPFATKDRSTNVAALAVLSMGESWHNGHHAFPRSARHGLLAGHGTPRRCSSAVSSGPVGHDVHWPTPEAVRSRRGSAPRRWASPSRMTGDRMAVVVRDLAANGIGRRRLPAAVSATCASLLDIEHSGLLLADDDGNLTALATTTPMMALVEDLEVTLGEDPAPTRTSRATRRGARPGGRRPLPMARLRQSCAGRGGAGRLRLPTAGHGRLDRLPQPGQAEPGALTGDQHLDAVALAGVVAQLLVTLPLDTVDGAVELHLLRHRTVVHQATGMVGAQLDVTMAVGLALLRARAFADDRALDKVAADVVEHRLRFDT